MSIAFGRLPGLGKPADAVDFLECGERPFAALAIFEFVPAAGFLAAQMHDARAALFGRLSFDVGKSPDVFVVVIESAAREQLRYPAIRGRTENALDFSGFERRRRVVRLRLLPGRVVQIE